MIDVVIPTRAKSDMLEGLVEQIYNTAGFPCRVIHTGLNASASANRNLGLGQVAGDTVVMVDDDVEFNKAGWLATMARALERPEVVMVSAQLFMPDGKFAYMTGLDDCELKPKREGETICPSKRLLTACCAFKHCRLRFDEKYIGSGFEDLDFCNQLAAEKPDGVFLICHDAWVVHRNEARNQRGDYWRVNKKHYFSKWRG